MLATIARLEAKIAQQDARIAELEAQLYDVTGCLVAQGRLED